MSTADRYENLLTPCQLSFVYRLIAPELEGKKILDVGCSTGNYLERFSLDSIGLDYSEPNLEICRSKGLKVEKADFNKPIPFPDASFDVAFCSHVLEHVDSPLGLLREMNRVVRAGGRGILTLPTEHSLARITLRDPYFAGHPTHFYGFSLECISRLVGAAGFVREKIILDLPLLKRLNCLGLLRMAQLIPKKLGMMISGSFWIIAAKCH